MDIDHDSVEQIVIVLVAALSALASLPALASLALTCGRLRFHFDVSVGEAVEEEVGSEFFVFVAGEVGLCGLKFAEAEGSQAVDGLLVGLRDENGAGRCLLASLLPRNCLRFLCAFSLLAGHDDLFELVGVLRDELSGAKGTL